MTDNNTVTGSPLVKRGLADMLKGGVIMDVVTPNRLRSLKMLALLPSWLSSAFPRIFVRRAAWLVCLTRT